MLVLALALGFGGGHVKTGPPGLDVALCAVPGFVAEDAEVLGTAIVAVVDVVATPGVAPVAIPVGAGSAGPAFFGGGGS